MSFLSGLLLRLFGVGSIATAAGEAFRLLRSPIGILALVTLVVMVARCDARKEGFKEATLECNTASLRQEVTEVKKQLQAAERIAEDADRATAEAEKAQLALQKKLEGLTNEIRSSEDNDNCVLTDYDRDRVQQIRNAK